MPDCTAQAGVGQQCALKAGLLQLGFVQLGSIKACFRKIGVGKIAAG